MFNHSMSSEKMKRPARLTWLTLPLSLLLHVLLIASLVVVPLIRADASLPKVKVFSVSITAPPMPLPPSKGTGKKNTGGEKMAGEKKTNKNTGRPETRVPSTLFQAPCKVPEAIEEELINTGIGSGPIGDDGGIPDGFDGGDPNALIGVEKGEKVDESLPALRIANLQMPRKIKEVKPVYSVIALAAHVQGRVIIEAMTDIYGRVRNARIVYSASPLLNESALNAIKQWLYEPYVLNGIPKPVVFTVTITFTLQ
ncbi:MAG: energy transducer TonB [Candidatus Aminicenantes bacterium]|nr:energy transducer TonB [Candidatus Aminicenantes bacterium]